MQRRFMIISASSLLMVFVLSAVTTVTALAQKTAINVSHRFIESRNLGQGKVRNVWRVDWTVNDTRSFSATAGAEARTKTLLIGKVSLVNIQAAIEEVKVRLIAETKFSGRNEVAQ